METPSTINAIQRKQIKQIYSHFLILNIFGGWNRLNSFQQNVSSQIMIRIFLTRYLFLENYATISNY